MSAEQPDSPTKGKRKSKGKDADGGPAERISVAGHPRARRMVRRAREAAGLAGFLIAGWLSFPTHTLAGTLLSAIVAGVACELVVWAAAVLLSGQLIVAEIRDRELAVARAAGKAAGAGTEPSTADGGRARAANGPRRPRV